MVKNLPAMRETWVWSLGRENSLEKRMATHFCILAWRTPWIEEPGGLQSKRSQRVRYNWATNTHTTHSENTRTASREWPPHTATRESLQEAVKTPHIQKEINTIIKKIKILNQDTFSGEGNHKVLSRRLLLQDGGDPCEKLRHWCWPENSRFVD